MYFIVNFIKKIIYWILPNYCQYCYHKLKITDKNCFCQKCWDRIKLISKYYCKKCYKPVITAKGICNECRNRKIYYNNIKAIGVYEEILKQAIILYKFSYRWKIGYDFSELIQQNINAKFITDNDFLVPVPLTKTKLLERGFHHTFFIIKALSKIYNIPVIKDLLIKKQDTPPQSLLSRQKRLVNLHDKFKINSKYLNLINKKKILLFDDVYTTGATIQECSKTLKNHNVKEINTLILARGR